MPYQASSVLKITHNTKSVRMLSDSEASDANDDTHQLLTINETFAKAYKVRKEREELAKCKSALRWCWNVLLRMHVQ